MLSACCGICPKLGELLAESYNLLTQARIDADGIVRSWNCSSQQCFFRTPQFDQSSFPSPLKLTGYKPVVGINTIELTFGERGLIAKALNLLLLGAS